MKTSGHAFLFALALLLSACDGGKTLTGEDPLLGPPVRSLQFVPESGCDDFAGPVPCTWGSVGRPFTIRLRAIGADSSAVSGAIIRLKILDGGGALSVSSVTTDAEGFAEFTLALGSTAGSNTVEARAAGLTTPHIFTIRGGPTPLLVLRPDSIVLTEVGRSGMAEASVSVAGYQRAGIIVGFAIDSTVASTSYCSGCSGNSRFMRVSVHARGAGATKLIAFWGGAADTVPVKVMNSPEPQ